ncbi:putative transcriptional regulator, ArsR family protein [Brachybacterium conglomeratum]|nr:putative transcriptional regulator, ArsR family protein [Brachybacterium conglomeratum]GLK06572.1 putative transcriptional regulator, ArsR family protein [Brachybacterium conglomeratum]
MAMTSLEDQVRMHGIDPGAVTADAMMPAASLFHSFSDPNRLIILHHLQLGEHRVVDLTQHLGLSQSTVSKHLICLRDTGMVTVRPEGRASVYSLAHSEALIDLLSAAERLLGLTGDGVILCTLHGSDIVSPRS